MDSRDVDRCILSLLLRIASFLNARFVKFVSSSRRKEKGKEEKKRKKYLHGERRAFMYESALMNLESDRNERIKFISFGENDKRILYPLFTQIFLLKDVVDQRPR